MDPIALEQLPYLRLNEEHTRLLELLPMDQSGNIYCHLWSSVNLKSICDGAVQFDVLSYEWKDPVLQKSIWINMVPACMGWRVSVRENLYGTLWNLSRRDNWPEKRRLLWVDAVCINQGDEKEKGEQVQGMGELYSRATTVIVWLGTAADGSDVAFDYFYAALAPNSQE
jgi:hypothetical protein